MRLYTVALSIDDVSTCSHRFVRCVCLISSLCYRWSRYPGDLQSRDRLSSGCRCRPDQHCVQPLTLTVVQQGVSPKAIRVVILQVRRLAEQPGSERLLCITCDVNAVNLYGPSEDTTCILRMHGRDDTSVFRSAVRCRTRRSFYLMDGVALSDWVWRALHRRGGLARGYLARPGLTGERFIPQPVWRGRAAVPDRGPGALAC